MGRILLLALVSALVMAGGCLDRRAVVCDDGRICAAGSVCVTALDLCASDAQVNACLGIADGEPCTADGIPGRCTFDVCFPSGCNGVLEADEQCDDDNTVGGDGCSADCRSNETCGNGIVDRGVGGLDEECDCGVTGAVSPACSSPNSDLAGVCSRSCRRRCGDGVVASDEQCDWNAPDANFVSCGDAFDRGITSCRTDCTPNVASATCRQIGWRTVRPQPPAPNPPIVDVAAITFDDGFFVNATGAGRYDAMGTVQGSFYTTTPLEMTAVWTDGTAAIAVGQGGTTLHWNGTAWMPRASGTSVDLHDLWVRSAGDAYAVGDASTVLHWNGQVWSTLTPPQVGALRDAAGDATRVFAVADDGELLRLDASGWAVIDTGTTVDLDGVAVVGGLVVAVGPAGTIVEDDGNGWRAGRTLATDDLHAVWGNEALGFFAVGDGGTILHRDGGSWRPMSLGTGVTGSPSQSFTVVREAPGAMVGAIGGEDVVAYQGAAWSPVAVPTAVSINGLWGSAPDDVFAVGRDGTILHYDGLRWTVQPSDTTVDLRAVHGRGPADVYAVGDESTIVHHDGADWTTVRSAASGGFSGPLRAVLAGDPGVLHVGGDEGLFRVEGSSLTRLVTTAVNGLWGRTPATGWSVGARIHRLAGGTWTDANVNVTTPLRAVSGFDNAVYAVGGVSRWFDGNAWAIGPFTDADLNSVSTAYNSAALAVGGDGRLRNRYGPALEPMRSRTTADLRAVFSIGHLVFMAGDDGTLDILVFHE